MGKPSGNYYNISIWNADGDSQLTKIPWYTIYSSSEENDTAFRIRIEQDKRNADRSEEAMATRLYVSQTYSDSKTRSYYDYWHSPTMAATSVGYFDFVFPSLKGYDTEFYISFDGTSKNLYRVNVEKFAHNSPLTGMFSYDVIVTNKMLNDFFKFNPCATVKMQVRPYNYSYVNGKKVNYEMGTYGTEYLFTVGDAINLYQYDGTTYKKSKEQYINVSDTSVSDWRRIKKIYIYDSDSSKWKSLSQSDK